MHEPSVRWRPPANSRRRNTMGSCLVAVAILWGASLIGLGSAHSARAGPNTLGTSLFHLRPATAIGCSKAPCPMGVNDVGLLPNGTGYSYVTGQVESFVDIYSLASGATTGGCFDPNAKYCLTIQSNWVDSNVDVHGVYGTYWAQNVAEVGYDPSCSAPCVSKTFSVVWLDNIWNMSAPGGCNLATKVDCVNSGDVVGNGTGSCTFLGGGGKIWICAGWTVWGLKTPFTIQTLMQTGVLSSIVGNFPQLVFYGGVWRLGKLVSGGTYDQVSFLPGSAPPGSPKFKVDGTRNTPDGHFYDGEFDLGGPGGGGKITLSQANLLMETYYRAHNAWLQVPHAWSSGADTAESVTNGYVTAFGGNRHAASFTLSTENPRTNLW